MFKIIVAAVIVTIIGLFIMTKIDPNVAANSSIVIVENSVSYDSDSLVKVSISGQILHSGSYSISPLETLGSLIDMAGGTLENADPDSYTPGLVIGPRTSFYIPKASEIPATCEVTKIDKVNINTADQETLVSVKFYTSQATALIDYRNINGDFQALEDIMKVSGIGEKTYITVRDYISLS